MKISIFIFERAPNICFTYISSSKLIIFAAANTAAAFLLYHDFYCPVEHVRDKKVATAFQIKSGGRCSLPWQVHPDRGFSVDGFNHDLASMPFDDYFRAKESEAGTIFLR